MRGEQTDTEIWVVLNNCSNAKATKWNEKSENRLSLLGKE